MSDVLRTLRRSWWATLLAAALAACSGGAASPTAPSQRTSTSTGPFILVAGQSSAYFLAPLFLPNVIDMSQIDASIDVWLNSATFAGHGRSTSLQALVWWQGSADVQLSTETYASKLRAVIALARVGDPALPIRIVELVDFPIRANVRAAQRQVAGDSGVEMIPTSDLPIADEAGHLTPDGYRTVRDRVYESLGIAR